MQRKLLGICGFLLFGTFGMLSGVAQAHHDERITPSETIALQLDVTKLQDMSPEEKERRREECARVHEACFDWCIKTTPRSQDKGRRGECIQDCSDKNTECMKKIPND